MKDRKTAILGGIFFFLLVIYLIFAINPPEKAKGAKLLFPKNFPDIERIEIAPPKEPKTVLEKKDGAWYIIEPFNFRASDFIVDDTLAGLREIMIDGVFSDRKEIQDQYSVGDSTGTSVKMYSKGKVVLDAFVGKHTVDASHLYARMRDSDNIVMWRGVAAVSLKRSPDDWRDKTIFIFNPQDVLSLKSVRGGITRELTLKDQQLIYTENGRARDIDQAKTQEYIYFISTLQGEGFADENDIPRVVQNKPNLRISLAVRNGDTHNLDVWIPSGEEDHKRYLLREENGEIIYRIVNSGPMLELDYDKLKP